MTGGVQQARMHQPVNSGNTQLNHTQHKEFWFIIFTIGMHFPLPFQYLFRVDVIPEAWTSLSFGFVLFVLSSIAIKLNIYATY